MGVVTVMNLLREVDSIFVSSSEYDAERTGI